MKFSTLWKAPWRWLTSMRTALVLLFLLALGSIPGAILPQRSLNREKVESYIQDNGQIGRLYDRLQLFDVFSSHWYTAIYVLLFLSLIGCILPRIAAHIRAVRQPPVKAPKRLSRMPHHKEAVRAVSEAELRTQVTRRLRRWKMAETPASEDRAGLTSIAAERGFLREWCNIVFHIGLVAMLGLLAAGKLLYYEGQVIVIAGLPNSEFCNSAVANFDSFRNGALIDGTELSPFCVKINSFNANYLPNGQADMFRADVQYADKSAVNDDPATWPHYPLAVNHPLRLAGDRVYLQGHGFAPQVTITWPDGESRTQTVQFAPTEQRTFLSSGAMRFDPPAGMYPDLAERRKNQIAIQGLFAPTAQFSGENGTLLTSAYPAPQDPAVAIDIYRGDAGLDTGRAQNFFSLDMGQIHAGLLKKVDRVNLRQGETATLDDGTTVRFDKTHEFVNLQVSHDPTQRILLAATIVMLIALLGSVSIPRRRIWVRIRPLNPGEEAPIVTAGGAPLPGSDVSADTQRCVIEIAGLARSDRAGWGREFDRIAAELLELPDPDDEDEEELLDPGDSNSVRGI